MCRLLIVDDKSLTDNSLEDIINWKDLGCDIVGVTFNGNEALNIIKENCIDLVITDINILGLDGLNLISEIKRLSIKSKVIVISNNIEYKTVRDAMKNGAIDYLSRDFIDNNEVALLIEKVMGITSNNNEDNKDNYYISNLLKEVAKGYNISKSKIEEIFKKAENEILKKPYRIIYFKKEDGFLLNELMSNILNEARKNFINVMPIYLNNNNNILIFNESQREKVINIVTKNINKVKQNNNSNIYAILSDLCNVDYEICDLLKNTINKLDYCFYSFKNYIIDDESIKFSRKELSASNIKYRKEVEDIISYIDKNIQSKITLKMLSNDINMNESYLSRMFKRETGKNIVYFINERKMKKAMELLEDESILIKQVSKAVGIEDQFYFNKLFKKFYNVNPSDFKKKNIL
ncbi:response regulator transcription factor [Clostridium sp.]|uniref:response regulator transcription factor n=1 Tax=Clostridium sp. TaxID=1506 RepID=UPI003F2FBB43